MEFFETVSKRKTIRKYKQEQPPTDDVKKIINSARLAPSATNSQNWKFIAIYNDEVKQKMADAVVCEYDRLIGIANDNDIVKKMEHYKNFSVFFKDAPVVIACIETERKSDVTEFLSKLNWDNKTIKMARPDSSLLSMGGAIGNMSLAATALGYGTCWMCAPIIAYKAFKQILNLKETESVVSLLTLGHPYGENTKQPPKKSMEEIISIIK